MLEEGSNIIRANFDWSKSTEFRLSSEDKAEEIAADALDRAKYAEYLTKYINSFENRNYVLNLDSDWGTGKTYFLKRWYNSINKVHPCVYLDVWKHDFSDDPLLAIVSAIELQLRALSGNKEDSKAFSEVGLFLKGVAPHIAKGLAYKFTGVRWDELDANDEDDMPDADKKNLSSAVGAATQQLITQHNEQTKAIDEFKEQIRARASAILSSDHDGTAYRYPLYIFIDELDRCRPSFAVELLEVVKHLFDIPNVVFVIGSSTSQLQHAIRVLYGQGFNSQSYLRRFFNRRFIPF